jgi:hypothetical protein
MPDMSDPFGDPWGNVTGSFSIAWFAITPEVSQCARCYCMTGLLK